MKTAQQMALQCKKQDPGQWGHAKDNAVGYFLEGKWWPFALLAITGEWVVVPYVPKANGKEVYLQSDWIEV